VGPVVRTAVRVVLVRNGCSADRSIEQKLLRPHPQKTTHLKGSDGLNEK
jgi:hypothetical protein